MTGINVLDQVNLVNPVNINGVDYTWPGSNAAGVLINNGSGGLSWNNSPSIAGITLSGNASVGGTLGVTGAATFSSTGYFADRLGVGRAPHATRAISGLDIQLNGIYWDGGGQITGGGPSINYRSNDNTSTTFYSLFNDGTFVGSLRGEVGAYGLRTGISSWAHRIAYNVTTTYPTQHDFYVGAAVKLSVASTGTDVTGYLAATGPLSTLSTLAVSGSAAFYGPDITLGDPGLAGDHYISVQAAAANEASFRISDGTSTWKMYRPASSTDLRFYNSADRLIITAAGAVTIPGTLGVTGVATFSSNMIGQGWLSLNSGGVPSYPLDVRRTTGADWAAYIANTAAAGSSYGLYVQAAANSSDYSLYVVNRSAGSVLFYVRGDGYTAVNTGGFSVAGGATIGGTLGVTGAATFSSTINQTTGNVALCTTSGYVGIGGSPGGSFGLEVFGSLKASINGLFSGVLSVGYSSVQSYGLAVNGTSNHVGAATFGSTVTIGSILFDCTTNGAYVDIKTPSATVGGIILRRSDTTRLGWIYGDSFGFGLLDSQGNWAHRIATAAGAASTQHEWSIAGVSKLTLTSTALTSAGNIISGGYFQVGGSSGPIVRMNSVSWEFTNSAQSAHAPIIALDGTFNGFLTVNGGPVRIPVTSTPTWDTTYLILWQESGFGARYNAYRHRWDVGSGAEAMRIDTNGWIGVNIGAAPSYRFDAWEARDTYAFRFVNINNTVNAWGITLTAGSSGGGQLIDFSRYGSGTIGSINHNGSTTAYNTTSDRRAKVKIADALIRMEHLRQVKPRRFAYKDKPDDVWPTGWVAQDVRAVFPQAVSIHPTEGTEMLDYGRMSAFVGAALLDYADTTDAEIAALKRRIAVLERGR